MKYILFQCMDCKQMVAYPERTADGHRCKHCNGLWMQGMLKPINSGTKEELTNRYIAHIEFPSERDRKRVNQTESVPGRHMTSSEIASAIAQWCKREGYKCYSVSTKHISQTEIIVEADISK